MLVTLERLAHSDINLLRELRNANADSFFNSKLITVADQEDWWYRYSSSPGIQFYTIWLNGVTPVGFLSVRYVGDTDSNFGELQFEVREIGNLLLAPAHRHRGIMHMAITEARRLYDPLTFWIAHVKTGNTASLRLFERQEFVPVSSKGDCVWGSSLKNMKPL